MNADQSWKAQGNCAGASNIMFPLDATGAKAAKALCAHCTVRSPCLAYALDLRNNIHGGVWGGLTEYERTGKIPGRPGPPRQPCGTRAAYSRGCRCDPCVEASRRYQAERATKHAFASTTLEPTDVHSGRGRGDVVAPPGLAAQPVGWERRNGE